MRTHLFRGTVRSHVIQHVLDRLRVLPAPEQDLLTLPLQRRTLKTDNAPEFHEMGNGLKDGGSVARWS